MHILLNFFKNYFLRIVFVNRLNKSILWGLIFSFVSTFSLGEVPEKITAAISREKDVSAAMKVLKKYVSRAA